MSDQSKLRNGVIVVVSMTVFLLAGAAWAVQPEALPRKGGIGACELNLAAVTANLDGITSELKTCSEDLATCENECSDDQCSEDLATCEEELAQCRESNVFFPGDGAGNGMPLAYEECADGLTLADLNTGLLWELKVAGNALCTDFLHRVNSECEWGQATGAWINAVNAEGGAGFAGFSDWRMPNIKELQSIVNYGMRLPAIDPAFGETQLDPNWSATPLLESAPAEAWAVNFRDGKVAAFPEGTSWAVRAVRTGQCAP